MSIARKLFPIYLILFVIVISCTVAASKSVTLISEALAVPDPSLLPTVVLDPGHGGEDGGALSPGGVRESRLNLEISLRTRDLLRFVGIQVVMTRETDRSIYSPDAETVSEKKVSDLKNRVKLVNETQDALLISIHQNMFSEAKYYGAQVFYSDTRGSQALAEALQDCFTSKLDPTNHRQAKPCQTVYLLNKIRCPGVLIECGFLSNPAEEAKLQDAGYQKKIAAIITAGLTTALLERTNT